MKTTVLAVIAIVSTAAAIVEGVMLVQLSRQQETSVAATSSGEATSSTRTASTDGAGATALNRSGGRAGAGTGAAAETGATPGESKAGSTSAVPADATKEGPKAAGAAGAETGDAGAAKELSAEEKQAREEAEQARKLKEFMDNAAEQQIKQMLAQLNLTDAQREQAGPTIDKLRQALKSLMTEPQQIGQNYAQRIKTLTEEAKLRGETEEQIAATSKAEQATMMTEIKEVVVGGMAEMGATVEDLRPVLDAQQATKLDQMHKELKQGQEMVIRMMDAAVQNPPPVPTP